MVTEYVRHFGMKETPFARNHDPRWFYLSAQYKEAVMKTRWAVEEHCGLSLLRGDVGQGKSFLVEFMMTQWGRQFGWRCARLQNTTTIASPKTLLDEILAAFGLEPASTTRRMVARLENWLLEQVYEQQQMVVLFIDEAQSIGSRAFPVLRDLLNLQTRERILMHIALSAQLNIDRKLSYYPALQSRIATVSTLEPLCAAETDAMLLHRFRMAGALDPFVICPAETMHAIHVFSGGVPRDILVVTEAAMQEAFLRDSVQVLPGHVAQAVQSLACRQPRAAKMEAQAEAGRSAHRFHEEEPDSVALHSMQPWPQMKVA